MKVYFVRGLVAVTKVFFSAGVRKENGILVKASLHKLQKYAQKWQLQKQILQKIPLNFGFLSDLNVVLGRF